MRADHWAAESIVDKETEEAFLRIRLVEDEARGRDAGDRDERERQCIERVRLKLETAATQTELSLTLAVRNLAAHKYVNTGARMTLQGQLEDSINITGQTWLTALLFPIGLRYHALHHLFPAMPYHAMGEAHRRLMSQLPADASYRLTDYPNFFAAVSQLWRGARHSAGNGALMQDWRRLGAPGA